MCQQIAFQAQNSDGKPFVSAHNPNLKLLVSVIAVILGYVGWVCLTTEFYP
jgi:hypothetical protein